MVDPEDIVLEVVDQVEVALVVLLLGFVVSSIDSTSYGKQ